MTICSRSSAHAIALLAVLVLELVKARAARQLAFDAEYGRLVEEQTR